MSVVIRIENLSKHYRLGLIGGGTLREDLTSWWARTLGRRDSLDQVGIGDHGNRKNGDLWALQDVSFDVRQGEILGIIGRNGAGKSTLLKVLSRITAPTSGQIKIKGRVGSLLEVGTGFHPELTGRENIFLNGAILGMKKGEINRKLDEIIDFAEIERFIDTPVKRYSSGMYVRLAFAVAAHLEPEILVIDEVLAVGDVAFQKKCLGKMGDVAKHGRTVLFVSHNMAAVSNLCGTGLYLAAGKVTRDGEIADVIRVYLQDSSSDPTVSISKRSDRNGSGIARFSAVDILDAEDRRTETVMCGQRVRIRIKLSSDTTPLHLRNVNIAIGMDNSLGHRVWHLANESTGAIFPDFDVERDVFCFDIPRMPLVADNYSMVLFLSSQNTIIDWIENAVSFRVESGDFYGTGRLPPAGQGCFLADYTVGVSGGYV